MTPQGIRTAYGCPESVANYLANDVVLPAQARAVLVLGAGRVRWNTSLSRHRASEGGDILTCWLLDGLAVTEQELVSAAKRG
jgi:hypothetical protein